jgi:hypothetical protein
VRGAVRVLVRDLLDRRGTAFLRPSAQEYVAVLLGEQLTAQREANPAAAPVTKMARLIANVLGGGLGKLVEAWIYIGSEF